MTGKAATGGPRSRFEALDGLRGLSALMVVLLHLPLGGPLGEIALFRHSFLFVDFFFVLSGFVIAHSYGERLRNGTGLRHFAFSRWRRVYPLHLAMLVLFLAFELATYLAKGPGSAFEGGNSVSAFVANLLLVHAFGTVPALGWNYPSWSISAEFGAYLLFAASTLAFRRRLPVALVAVVAVGLPALGLLVGHIDTTIAFGWLRCLVGFACGATLRLAIWRAPAATAPTAGATLRELLVAALVVAFVILAGATPLSLAAPIVFTLAVAIFAREEGAVSRLLKSPECRFLGLVSYSIYMTHAFVISRMINVATVAENRTGLDLVQTLADGSKAFTPLASPLALTGTLVATVIFSALTHRFIEVPGQRWRLTRSAAPELAPAAPVAP